MHLDKNINKRSSYPVTVVLLGPAVRKTDLSAKYKTHEAPESN